MSKKERVNKNVVYDECEIFVSFARSIITQPNLSTNSDELSFQAKNKNKVMNSVYSSRFFN